MWSRVISCVAAMVIALQLGALASRRAAAAPPPVKAAPRLLVMMDGPELGQQIASDQIDELSPWEMAPAERLPQDQHLLSEAITSLARCREMESAPQCPTAADRGWAGRFGVELLDEARAGQPDRSPGGLVQRAIRQANAAVRSADTADRLTRLDEALRTARRAFALAAGAGVAA